MSKSQKFFIGGLILITVFLVISVITVYKSREYLSKVQAKETNVSKQIDKNLKIPEISGLQGGYLPKNDIIIGNYKFACIIINTNSNNKIEDILFQIKDKDEKLFAKISPCKDFEINSDKLIIKPTTTLIGNISFDGIFLPVKNGDYIKVSYNSVVLKGKLLITRDGKNLYVNNKQEFTFLFGD